MNEIKTPFLTICVKREFSYTLIFNYYKQL